MITSYENFIILKNFIIQRSPVRKNSDPRLVFIGRIILAKVSLNKHVLLSISYTVSRFYKKNP